MLEISLKGRGGQGVVTAGELLVSAAIKEGIYGQSIPFYGGERRGAPVTSEVRVSKEPIFMHRRVYNPDIIAIFDPSLINLENQLEGLKNSGILVINSSNPKRIWKNTYVLDATKIATQLGLIIAGWAVVNTAMVGAIAKITDILNKGEVEEAAEEEFEGKLGELNAEAVKLGYNEVKKLE